MTDIDLRLFGTTEALVSDAAGLLGQLLGRALTERGRASLVLSGGSSPKPVYEALAKQDLAWDGVGIGLVDERWVPSGHAASNADFIQACFDGTPAARAQFMPLYNGHETPSAGLDAAEQALALLAQPFDI
ncbi:MAG: 6-phosphogluconolactonase, partial [Litorimonas sp.]